ncbi:preprotein translocase subunit SecE [Asticcacaulis tiandongensis]|uniref:preprotein translocase subunit SecE n=1 Tax=Asticcacaulis tiandongensis TaxID=2565365 RepID=UPI0011269463|nr:preprotein translocase subunit SecE [Asticcacaulis tiandongensis]
MVKKTPNKPVVESARKGSDIAKAALKTAGAGSGTTGGASAEAAPKKRTSPGKFINEVRQEGRKISWPSRKETWITTVMVLIMVLIAAVFFYIIDGGLGFAVNYLISIGR